MDARPNSGRGTKRRRLSRSAEFERVYRHGRSKGNRFLVVYRFPRDEDADEGPRLGLSVSKRVGGSVERSRLKRVLREAFRAEQSPGAPSAAADYVLVARPPLRELDEREGLEGVRRVLRELLESPARQEASGRRRAASQA